MSQLIINTWFPIAIGKVYCPFINEIKDKYKNIIKKFEYNHDGFCYYPVHKNKKFDKLNKWIKDSWILDYPIGKGQPFHTHLGFTISCVFYLDAQKNDSPTIFSNPFVDMKNPTHTTVRNMKNVVLNNLTYQQCGYSCETGKLVIFRSNISHAVDPKQIKEKRIVFSYNFDPK
jgi:uncharacterized protein (TIGR02466 family)